MGAGQAVAFPGTIVACATANPLRAMQPPADLC